jgi:hypothetical protein
MQDRQNKRDNTENEGGFALLIVLFMTIIIVGVTFSGHARMEAIRRKSEAGFRLHAQASQFARSGITECLSWFKKQTTQPVLGFAPVLDTSANPPRSETSDPDIGLVRDFRITGNVWGRYEIYKPWDADPDSQRLAFRQRMQARDISLESGQPVKGIVWRIVCIGTVYRQMDGSKAPNEWPNTIIAKEVLETEFHRTLSLTPPGKAALCSSRGDLVTLGNRARVLGGGDGAGIYYLQNTGAPILNSGSTLDGLPAQAVSSAYAGSPTSVLGVSIEELKLLADIVAKEMKDLPDTIPQGGVVVIQNSLPVLVDSAKPLKGRGIVLFDTPYVYFAQGNLSDFYGLVYFTGQVLMDAPTRITGAVVTQGQFTMQGTGDFSNLDYDETVLNDLRKLYSYRVSGSVRRTNNN